MGLTVLLTLAGPALPSAHAGDWTTKGGTPEHQSYADHPLGLLQPEVWWSTEGFGETATQPIVVGDRAYHVAGNHLFTFILDEERQRLRAYLASSLPVNEDTRSDSPHPGKVLPPSSTPTYSPASGMLYFGTTSGLVWAFDTRRGYMRDPLRVSNCPIVASPLVIRKDGRDLVVVTDKQQQSGDLKCTSGPGGRAYLIWGLDREDEPNVFTTYEELQGSWMTPSPVPVPDTNPPRLVVAADGLPPSVCGGEGTVRLLQVIGGPDPPYFLLRVPAVEECSDHGFAGSLSSDGERVYWVDTAGNLYSRSLESLESPETWPSRVHLPSLIHPGGTGFTNTEPAIDPESGTVYVTLRNYRHPGDPFSLRGCPDLKCPEPGAPGAILAINAGDGTLKWARRLVPESNDPLSYPAINTAPLLLKSLDAVLFGDVNGRVHAYSLSTGEPAPFMVDDGCIPLTTFPLLPPGTKPARGEFTWSQQSGVSSDPMLAVLGQGTHPLILTGVNYQTDQGPKSRFVALRAGRAYNLKWSDARTDPPSPWRPGTSVTLQGRVRLEFADESLGQLRSDPVFVSWFLVPAGEGEAASGRFIGQTQLPPSLRPDEEVEVQIRFDVLSADPEEGYVIGLIDLPTVNLYTGRGGVLARTLAERLGRAPSCPLGLREVAEMRSPATDGVQAAWQLDDNYLVLPYRKQALPDLSLTIEAPPTVPWQLDGTYEVRIHVTNHSAETLTVPVEAGVRTSQVGEWSLGTRQVTVGPGATVTTTRTVYIQQCKDVYVVRAAVNPDGAAVPESDLANNAAAAMTIIGDCSGERIELPRFTAGPGRTVIVPPDCVPKADPYAARPCEGGSGPTIHWP